MLVLAIIRVSYERPGSRMKNWYGCHDTTTLAAALCVFQNASPVLSCRLCSKGSVIVQERARLPLNNNMTFIIHLHWTFIKIDSHLINAGLDSSGKAWGTVGAINGVLHDVFRIKCWVRWSLILRDEVIGVPGKLSALWKALRIN